MCNKIFSAHLLPFDWHLIMLLKECALKHAFGLENQQDLEGKPRVLICGVSSCWNAVVIKLLWSGVGMRKTYWITCNNDTEMQNVLVERNSFPSHLVVKPRDLSRLLAHFQSSLQEITLIATEPISSQADTDSEAKAIELKSYIDPARGDYSDVSADMIGFSNCVHKCLHTAVLYFESCFCSGLSWAELDS